MRARLGWALSLALAVVVLTAGVAFALNTHTVWPYNHGLGDGKNNDNYVHPFNHHKNKVRRDGLKISASYAYGQYYAILVVNKDCNDCYHLHHSIDTGAITQPNGVRGVRECKFYSGHSMPGIDWHFHHHHNYCG